MIYIVQRVPNSSNDSSVSSKYKLTQPLRSLSQLCFQYSDYKGNLVDFSESDEFPMLPSSVAPWYGRQRFLRLVETTIVRNYWLEHGATRPTVQLWKNDVKSASWKGTSRKLTTNHLISITVLWWMTMTIQKLSTSKYFVQKNMRQGI